MMPPGGRVYMDLYNCRWLATQAGHGVRSRSWATYGHRDALMRCLAWCWEKFGEDTGIACPIKEVAGVMGGKGATANVPTKGGAAAASSSGANA